MVVPPSFGDIVAAIGIVRSIYNALSDSTRSPFDYQCLIEELRSFEEALCIVNNVLKTTAVSNSIRKAIEEETTACPELLAKFRGRIDGYTVLLHSVRRAVIWRKITWVIWKAREVESFRRGLSHHKQNITIFLCGLQITTATSGAGVIRQDLALIKVQVDEIHAIQLQPPSRVGYDLGNALTLIDALGECITLPMQFCWSQDELHQTLICLFQGKTGQDHVERHDYSISTEDGKSIIESNNWDAIVRKGTVIVMSVIAKKWHYNRTMLAAREIHVHIVMRHMLASCLMTDGCSAPSL